MLPPICNAWALLLLLLLSSRIFYCKMNSRITYLLLCNFLLEDYCWRCSLSMILVILRDYGNYMLTSFFFLGSYTLKPIVWRWRELEAFCIHVQNYLFHYSLMSDDVSRHIISSLYLLALGYFCPCETHHKFSMPFGFRLFLPLLTANLVTQF